MKKYILLLSFCFCILADICFCSDDNVPVKRELSIQGDSTGFGIISDLAVDEAGTIFILDQLRANVFVYDRYGSFLRTIGKSKCGFLGKEDFKANQRKLGEAFKYGIEPGELLSPRKFFIKGNLLYILDIRNICVYSKENAFIRFIRLEGIGNPSWIFVNNNGEIVALGKKKNSDKIVHIFDQNGSYLYSFCPYFSIPSGFTVADELKESISASPYECHYSYDTSENHEYLLLLNPFKYEIRIIKDNFMDAVLSNSKRSYRTGIGTISGFVGGQKAGFILDDSMKPTILKNGEWVFAFFPIFEQMKLQSLSADVYRKFAYHNSLNLSIKGRPMFMDSESNIYCIESNEDGNDFISKYQCQFNFK